MRSLPIFVWINVIVLMVVFLISPYVDVYISALFVENGHFLFEDNWFTNLIDKGIPEIIVAISVLIMGLWIAGKVWCKIYLGITTQVMLLTSGTMIFGPIVVVNGIFKSFWGRARPMNIETFGGDKNFSLPMQIANQCDWDCSFMSGHTAVAFWTLSLALLAPKKWRKTAVTLSVMFGIITAVVRIGQGAHFFSDVVFAAVVMCVIIVLTYRRLFPQAH